IGLEHVAIDADLALAEGREVDDGAQAAADEALDFLGAAALPATRRLAVGARMGRARQHAIFGGDPAAPGVTQEGRHFLLDRGGAQDMSVAEAGEAGSLGVFGKTRLEADRAQFVRGTTGRARHGVILVPGVTVATLKPLRPSVQPAPMVDALAPPTYICPAQECRLCPRHRNGRRRS